MRIEAAGAQITAASVAVIESLQTDGVTLDLYTSTIDRLMWRLISDSDENGYDPADTLAMIQTVISIKRDLITLAAPPDVDDPENDAPVFSI